MNELGERDPGVVAPPPANGPESCRQLIAAIGELAGLIVLQVDKDFDLSASFTSQVVEPLAGDF